MAIDLAALLGEVSPGEPCGPDLEYDRAFGELERAAQGKPEQQMGDTLIPAQEPDWKQVEAQSLALLARTRDLRIACHLTKALLRTRGWPGFADGLALVRGLVERFWEPLHPRLDPDDGLDPTMRVNTLLGLCDASSINAVRAAALVSSRQLGRYGLRELAVAAGEAQPTDGAGAVDMATLEAAFTDADLGSIQETATAVHAALEHVRAIEANVGDKAGASALNMGKLASLLKTANDFVAAQLARRTMEAGASEGGAGNNGTSAPGSTGGRLSGDIRSREDVLRALDKIVGYYQQFEPASPVPLLMKRAKRLVTMSFLDIVKDMAPDAMNHVQLIAGRDPDGDGEGGSQ